MACLRTNEVENYLKLFVRYLLIALCAHGSGRILISTSHCLLYCEWTSYSVGWVPLAPWQQELTVAGVPDWSIWNPNALKVKTFECWYNSQELSDSRIFQTSDFFFFFLVRCHTNIYKTLRSEALLVPSVFDEGGVWSVFLLLLSWLWLNNRQEPLKGGVVCFDSPFKS